MNERKKKNKLEQILNLIEKMGNMLPNPITLFLYLAIGVLIVSKICSILGVTAISTTDGSIIRVLDLLSKDGVQYLWSNVIYNYANFAPLAVVLVAIIGSATAEKSGFLIGVMYRFLGGANGWIVTMAIIFFGINLNVAGDAGFVILPPLAALLYISIGRNPILGIYVSFASVAAGFAGNIFIGMADTLIYGFTEEAAKMIDPLYTETMAINWYFLVVSCIVLTLAGTLLVEKLLVKRFYISDEKLELYDSTHITGLTDIEKKGLRYAGITFLIYVAFIVLLSIPIGGNTAILADSAGSLTSSQAPFTSGIIFTITLALLVPGITYGVVTGRYKRDVDVWKDIEEGFGEMGSYVFMCFFISIFTNFFTASNLGTVLAIKGADFLDNVGFSGIPLMLGIIILSGFVNLLIGSSSAKWAILAPVFVPMMMLLDYDPALTQLLYRIGDSLTNPLSPLFTYMPIVLGYVRKYQKDAQMGTVIANMIPFSATFALVWGVQLIIWVLLDLPLGLGGGINL